MKSLTDIERHESEALLTGARRLRRAAPDLRDALEAVLLAFAGLNAPEQRAACDLAAKALVKSRSRS